MNARQACAALAITLFAPGADAASLPFAGDDPAAGAALPAPARAADIEERLGQPIDRRLSFTDTHGRTARLGDHLEGGTPALLVMAYYRCPMLCDLVLRGLAEGLSTVGMTLGDDYHALTVSFDPRDTSDAARAKQAQTLLALGGAPAPDDWPFLVGGEAESRRLASEIGFAYAYDARTDQYAHPALVVVLTPDGHISRYLYGTTFTARDLRLALVEAGEGKTGTIVDRVLLTCYRYDPASRRYGPYIYGFMRLGGIVILAFVSLLIVILWRGERRRARSARRAPR